MEGISDPGLLIQRLSTLVNEYEINLVSARADRFEASFNRSLRSQQDEAFLESLRADQEKERRREEQRLAEEAERQRLEAVSCYDIPRTRRIVQVTFSFVSVEVVYLNCNSGKFELREGQISRRWGMFPQILVGRMVHCFDGRCIFFFYSNPCMVSRILSSS